MKKEWIRSDAMFAYALLLPATLFLIMVRIYPLFKGMALGFTNSKLLGKNVDFVGFENFIYLMHDKAFWNSLSFTFVYTFSVVVIAYLFGLLIAILMNKDIRGRGIFRAMFLIPWVIPAVVAGASWQWSLNDQTGIFNNILIYIGLIDKPLLFLASPFMAKLTVIIEGAWKSYPFICLSLLAGLQNIPNELYESAKIDGANRVQSFINITMPMLKHVTMMVIVLMTVWTMNNFDNIYLLTMGGPANSTNVVSILSYYTAFYRFDLGYASAISSFMLVVMMILAIGYMKFVNRGEE